MVCVYLFYGMEQSSRDLRTEVAAQKCRSSTSIKMSAVSDVLRLAWLSLLAFVASFHCCMVVFLHILFLSQYGLHQHLAVSNQVLCLGT